MERACKSKPRPMSPQSTQLPKTQTQRNKVVFDLHLQHLAFFSSPPTPTPPSLGSGGPGEVGKPLIWQASEQRGGLKFRLRLRSPAPSICLLLDESKHEIVLPFEGVTSLKLFDRFGGVETGRDARDGDDGWRVGAQESLVEMEKRLRLDGMVLELGIVKGCKKEFRRREPNRYVRLSSSSISTCFSSTDHGPDPTGGAANETTLIRLTVHSSVTRELTTSMVGMVVGALEGRSSRLAGLGGGRGEAGEVREDGRAVLESFVRTRVKRLPSSASTDSVSPPSHVRHAQGTQPSSSTPCPADSIAPSPFKPISAPATGTVAQPSAGVGVGPGIIGDSRPRPRPTSIDTYPSTQTPTRTHTHPSHLSVSHLTHPIPTPANSSPSISILTQKARAASAAAVALGSPSPSPSLSPSGNGDGIGLDALLDGSSFAYAYAKPLSPSAFGSGSASTSNGWGHSASGSETTTPTSRRTSLSDPPPSPSPLKSDDVLIVHDHDDPTLPSRWTNAPKRLPLPPSEVLLLPPARTHVPLPLAPRLYPLLAGSLPLSHPNPGWGSSRRSTGQGGGERRGVWV